MKREYLEAIINYISNGATISEISNDIQLSYQEIYKILAVIKSNGYEILKKYYSNGNIMYQLANCLFYDYSPRIITRPDEDTIEVMIYADLHFGSFSETPKLLDKIYDYSTSKGIHIHFNAGDFVEGVTNPLNIKIPWYKQIEHALRVYPHSDDILVFTLLGNHDYSLIENFGLDISEVIKNKRGDIIPVGFGSSKILIKNDYIILHHPLLSKDVSVINNYNNAIILRGHGHEMKTVIDNNNYIIYTPSLSNLNFNKSHFPGAIHMKLKMRFGLIEYVEYDELSFINNKLYTTGHMSIYTGRGKKFSENTDVKNEEEFSKVLKMINR